MNLDSVTGLLWLIGSGALFYFMMRAGGCGMQIEPGDAAGTRTGMGRTFYLCSADCLAKFDRDPDTYAKRSPTDEARPAQREHRRHAGC